jgi:hypothetical protein
VRAEKSEAKPRALEKLKSFMVALLYSIASGGDVSLLSLLRVVEGGECRLVV